MSLGLNNLERTILAFVIIFGDIVIISRIIFLCLLASESEVQNF